VGAEHAAAWEHELHTTGALVRRSRRSRMALVLLACVAFTAVSVLALLDGGVVLGIIGTAFFGVLGIPAIGWRFATGRPVLRVTASSVAVDRIEVPWSEVVDVRTVRLGRPGAGRLRLVVLGLKPAGAARRTAAGNGLARVLAPVNDRLTRGATLNLPDGLGLPAQELARWLSGVHARATGR
jgi:hypothetical protein